MSLDTKQFLDKNLVPRHFTEVPPDAPHKSGSVYTLSQQQFSELLESIMGVELEKIWALIDGHSQEINKSRQFIQTVTTYFPQKVEIILTITRTPSNETDTDFSVELTTVTGDDINAIKNNRDKLTLLGEFKREWGQTDWEDNVNFYHLRYEPDGKALAQDYDTHTENMKNGLVYMLQRVAKIIEAASPDEIPTIKT